MKFFTISPFGALASLFLVFANISNYIGSVQAAVLPRDDILNVPTNLIPEYCKLMDKCNTNDATVRSLIPRIPLLLMWNGLAHLNPLQRRPGGHLQIQWVFPKKVGRRTSRSDASVKCDIYPSVLRCFFYYDIALTKLSLLPLELMIALGVQSYPSPSHFSVAWRLSTPLMYCNLWLRAPSVESSEVLRVQIYLPFFA